MIWERAKNNEFLSWFLMILLSLIWGSSFILMKKGLVDFNPAQVAGIRISSAFLFLLPVAIRGLRELKKKHVKYLLISGILGSLIPAYLFTTAETKIESSVSGVLNGLTPLFTVIIGGLFFQLKFTRKTFIGVLIGFAGTIILITAGSTTNFWSANAFALYIVIATLFYGINVNIIHTHLEDLKASLIISFSMMMVGPIALGYLAVNAGIPHILQVSHTAVISLLASITLGVFGTAIAYFLFNKMIKINDPVFSSSVTYLIPVVAILWGVLDGEKLLIQHFIGVICILAGVFIARGIK